MIRILIVDDSATARLALRRIIERAGDGMVVVDVAASGREAEASAMHLRPDLITMDVHLGDADGVQLSQRILEQVSTRIVLVTGVDPKNPDLLFRALAAGALDVLAKPSWSSDDAATAESRFVRALRALAEVPIRPKEQPIRRPGSGPVGRAAIRALLARDQGPAEEATAPAPSRAPLGASFQPRRVLIGVSTGGPPLLESLLQRERTTLNVPVVVVQHVSLGFGSTFAEWLSRATGQRVVYVSARTTLEAGVVYIAPDDRHIHLVAPTTVEPRPATVVRTATPCIDELFESAAWVDAKGTLAMLLTGMGRDGAEGLLSLRNAGSRTVAQSPDTCVVDSMPRTAIRMGAAHDVMSPSELGTLLTNCGR